MINPETADLDIGQSQEFSAEAVDVYGNGIPEAQLIWEVAERVGTIIGDGFLTTATEAGIFEQAGVVTAVLGSVSTGAAASVTVNQDPVHDLSITPVEIAVAATHQLKAIATDQYGNRVTRVEITWAVLDANAGSIAPTGFINAGEVARSFPGAIEAKAIQDDLARTATTSVTVTPGPLDQVVIAPDTVEIGMEMSQQYVAVGADQYGNRIEGLTFSWSVETGGGTISSTGLFFSGSEPGTYNQTVKVTTSQGDITRSSNASVTVEPDRIAFFSTRNADQTDIYIMNADGSNVQRLTADGGLWATWSPDGRRIAYTNCTSLTCFTYVLNDNGSQKNIISEKDAAWAAWSPDGSRFAFTSDRDGDDEIYVMDLDGGNQTRLRGSPALDSFPAWSPDGTQIAFVTDRAGNHEIYVMNADGFSQRRLTNSSARDTLPAWSPDGTKILFQSDRDGDDEIYIMEADGTNLRQLTFNNDFDSSPSFSPDGTKILFHSRRDVGSAHLYVMNADGTDVRRLTFNSGDDFLARWAPRKMGLDVSEVSVVIPNASALNVNITGGGDRQCPTRCGAHRDRPGLRLGVHHRPRWAHPDQQPRHQRRY